MIWPVTEDHQRAAMTKMWSTFSVAEDAPIHLRAIWGKGVPGVRPPKNLTFNAATYPAVTDRQRAFEDQALALNTLGYNVYTTVNAVSPKFSGDEFNGLAVKDVDIESRRYLLLDFDRAKTDEPATDDEIDDVFRVAFGAELKFFYNAGQEPISVASGNGAHIYLPINLPTDEASKLLCQSLLKKLAAKYDTPTVKLDQIVFNAGRITKVPGTIARKGLEVEDNVFFNDRYYRMAEVIA